MTTTETTSGSTPTTGTGTATTKKKAPWAWAFESRTLNDSQTMQMNALKEQAGWLWDTLEDLGNSSTAGDVQRYVALSRTKLEETVMWATKAISRT